MASQSCNIRNLFLPTKQGWAFIDADWKAVENRIGAILTNETFLLEAFERGEDVYKKVYGEMFKVADLGSISKAQRQIGKALVLGQNYDMSKYGLAKQLKCSLDEAQVYIEQYAAAHPMTAAAKKNLLEFAKKEGYVRTYFGRVRYIPGLNSSDKGERNNAVREVWNTYIQGTAADILKISIVRLHKLLKEQKRYARMVMPIHDEILLQADMRKEDPWEIQEVMRDAMEISLCGIKLPVEPEFGWRFGSLTTDFEEFIEATEDKEIKARFRDSKYWQWKSDQAALEKQKPTQEKPIQKEQTLPPEIEMPKKEYPNAGEKLNVVETDFQKPALNVIVKKDLELPASFTVELNQYKSDQGLYLYFTVGHNKETYKYQSRVSDDITSLLRKIPNADIVNIR